MKCAQVQQLFGAYWDDETTQAEREALEQHFTNCADCRTEYETYSRSLELMASLPRAEAAPDLVERVLAQTRRAPSAPDRLAEPRARWVPVTAAAALLVLGIATVAPWIRNTVPSTPEASAPVAARTTVKVPTRVTPVDLSVDTVHRASDAQPLAVIADSVFDHSEDVEFILDPVTLKRGRVRSTTPQRASVQGERASITF